MPNAQGPNRTLCRSPRSRLSTDGPRELRPLTRNSTKLDWTSEIEGSILLFLGRIHEKRGCDLVVRAFASVAATEPTLQLVIAGPDQSGWAAQLTASSLGVADRISSARSRNTVLPLDRRCVHEATLGVRRTAHRATTIVPTSSWINVLHDQGPLIS